MRTIDGTFLFDWNGHVQRLQDSFQAIFHTPIRYPLSSIGMSLVDTAILHYKDQAPASKDLRITLLLYPLKEASGVSRETGAHCSCTTKVVLGRVVTMLPCL